MNWTHFEQQAQDKNYKNIAGVDEAGRGPLAGPVVASACIIKNNASIEGINDSKKLTPKKRSSLFNLILNHPDFHIGIGIVCPKRIDEINILQATFEAMKIAINDLPIDADFALIDGSLVPKISIPAIAIVKGDSKSLSIAAASIVAKETRDNIMKDLHLKHPEYGFDKHKGYPTKAHREAIEKWGAIGEHRMSFAPLSSMH